MRHTSHCIHKVTLQSMFVHSTNDTVIFLLQQTSSSSKDYLIGAGVGVGAVIFIFFFVVMYVRRRCLPGIPNVKLIASVNPEYVNTGKCQPSSLILSVLLYIYIYIYIYMMSHLTWGIAAICCLKVIQRNLDLSFFKGMEKQNDECGKTINPGKYYTL
jgi:hypothetical protein